MGRPLPAKAAGYKLYSYFEPLLCRTNKSSGKRPVNIGGKRPIKCGRRLPESSLMQKVLGAMTPKKGIEKKAWLAAVEKWYNHCLDYYPMKGASGAFVHSAGQRAKTSPLRSHLQTYLGSKHPTQVSSIIKALEAAYRLKTLSPKEYANAILSKSQRDTAKSRAAAGFEAALAKWLFDDDNWVFLCSNKTGVQRQFFVEPAKKERDAWPTTKNDYGKGDHTYLSRVTAKLTSLKKGIFKNLNDLKMYKNKFGVGMLAGEKAAILLRHASMQAILEDKKDWQGLLPRTRQDHLLKKTLMPVPQIWETPVGKVPKV